MKQLDDEVVFGTIGEEVLSVSFSSFHEVDFRFSGRASGRLQVDGVRMCEK